MEQQQFGEFLAMVQTALRHGFPQTWMYEGMTLALKANEASQEDIERAMMSVVDFSTTSDEMPASISSKSVNCAASG